MKKVHDIIRIVVGKDASRVQLTDAPNVKELSFPIALIQWGTEEEGYEYEFICPYCSHSVGWWVPASYTFGALAQNGAEALARHYQTGCSLWGGRFLVEQATEPLGTEKKPRVV